MCWFKKYLFCLALIVSSSNANAQLLFSSLDSLLSYVYSKSTTIQSGEIKFSQAQKAKLAAALGVMDLNGSVSFNVTNNITLPVSYFPAEAFGGAPGTFREVETGIQFTNNFTQSLEVKLINIAGWKNLKLARININSTVNDNKINLKNLYENIASSYANILTLQEQLKSTNENVKTADTLYQIVKNKFDLGVARKQELNDAQVNFLNTKESAMQIDFLVKQQYVALKILCDMPDEIDIKIQQNIINIVDAKPDVKLNQLSINNSLYKESYAKQNYRQLQFTLLPVVSAVISNSNQQFSSSFSLFDRNVGWVNSNYIGLKAIWQIPSASSISQISKAKYDYLLAKENTKHDYIKTQHDFKSLQIEFEKSESQLNTNSMVQDLQLDTYKKNLENYRLGIIGLDQLLSSYNAMVNSQYNYISSAANVLLAHSKIKINNEIQ